MDIQSATAEVSPGKKQEKKKIKPQLQNIMACRLLWAAITIDYLAGSSKLRLVGLAEYTTDYRTFATHGKVVD